MDPSHGTERQLELLHRIAEYVGQTKGLVREPSSGGMPGIVVRQALDGKALSISAADLEDVLFRIDADGQSFIQVNFSAGAKILLTDGLVGFKPAKLPGLGAARLPKVVTTPDILSVFEAIQEALHAGDLEPAGDDLELLRKVYEAVVSGGEQAGFQLAQERAWLARIPSRPVRATA